MTDKLSTSVFKQEVAKPGGYPTLNTSRVFGRRTHRFVWYTIGAASCIWFLTDIPRIRRHWRDLLQTRAENCEGRICIEPIMWAEVDRMLLRFLRESRDAEEEAMKDVPGWKTGTWFGEPIYKTRKFCPHYGRNYSLPNCSSLDRNAFAYDYLRHR